MKKIYLDQKEKINLNKKINNSIIMSYQTKKLWEIATYINWKAFKPLDWWSKWLPIIRIQNLNWNNQYNYFNWKIEEKYLINNWDILISWSASLDVYIWNWWNAVLNQHIFKVLINERIVNKKFFFYLIKNALIEIIHNTHWVWMKHITKWNFEKIKTFFPPLPTQKLIVQKLDLAFENIDKNINLTKENLKNLEDLNKSVLEEVFIKLEKEYWLSSISKSTLKAKSDIVDGPFWSNLKSWEYVSEWIPLIRLQNVDRFNFLRKDIKYVTIEKYNQLIRHSYKAWDIVITKLWSPLWKACIVPNDFAFWTIVADIIRVRVNNAENITKFIMFMINSINCWKQFIWNTQWSTRPRVKLSLVRELQIPLPPLQKQKEIVSYLDQIFEKNKQLKIKYELQLKELEELKQSLLKDAFEGRLVKE